MPLAISMPELLEHPTFLNGVLSLVAIVLFQMVRWVIERMLRRRSRIGVDELRRWLVGIRNFTVFATLVSLVFIWGSELRTLALSVVAFAAALVIATKEIILCISGSIYRTMTGSFALGDRIEIGNVRGDVIDETLLSTKILEVGPGPSSHQYTGRAIAIPNSMLLTHPVTNESFTQDFVLHLVTVPVLSTHDWELAESELLAAASEVCEPFFEDASRHLTDQAAARGLPQPSVEPRVVMQLTDPDKINLILRFPSPARTKGRMEQQILRIYLSRLARKPEA